MNDPFTEVVLALADAEIPEDWIDFDAIAETRRIYGASVTLGRCVCGWSSMASPENCPECGINQEWLTELWADNAHMAPAQFREFAQTEWPERCGRVVIEAALEWRKVFDSSVLDDYNQRAALAVTVDALIAAREKKSAARLPMSEASWCCRSCSRSGVVFYNPSAVRGDNPPSVNCDKCGQVAEILSFRSNPELTTEAAREKQ